MDGPKTHFWKHRERGVKCSYFWNKRQKQSRFYRTVDIDLEGYKRMYAPRPQTTLCDFTDSNSWITKPEIEEVHAHFPRARITYCIRNPITTIWSHVVKLGVIAPTAPLDQIMTRMFDDGSIDGWVFWRNVDYIKNLENWRSTFPAEQIHTYMFSEIARHPHQVLSDIAKHVGFPLHPVRTTHITAKVNKGRDYGIRQDVLDTLSARFRDDIMMLERLFDMDLSHWHEGKD